MKSVTIWMLILWLCLTLERAWSGRIVVDDQAHFVEPGALVIPAAVGCIFWFRSGRGILLAGAVLLGRWLLAPGGFPMAAVLVPSLSAWCLGTLATREDLPLRRWNWWQWGQPFFVAIAGLAVLRTHQNADVGIAVRSVGAALMVAVPTLLLILIITRLRSEFEMRRS